DLGQLLVAAVHVAARGVGPDDLLAVEAAHDAEGAVGGGVLRADVEGHALGLELDVDARVGRLARDVGGLPPIGSGGRHPPSPPSAGVSSSSSSPGLGSLST